MVDILTNETEKEIGILQQLMFFVTKNIIALGVTAITAYMVVNMIAMPESWILIQGYVMKGFFQEVTK